MDLSQWLSLVKKVSAHLFCKNINGILHFAANKIRNVCIDIIEFAPTVQCLTGNYKETEAGNLPFLDYILGVDKSQVIYDTFPSLRKVVDFTKNKTEISL